MSIYDAKHPVTDIVVLTYNNWKLSETCFDYILKNTVDFNLIVVDNGSSDDTVANVKKLQKKHTNIILIENGENKGVAGGRNIGAQAGNAEFLVNLDSDQFCGLFWLEEIFAIMNKCNVQMVGVDAWQMRPPKALKPYYPTKHCISKFDKFSYVGGGGNLIYRKVLEEVNFWDDNFSPLFFEDSDLQFRVNQAGHKTQWHYRSKIRHIGHQTIGKMKDASVQFQKSYRYFVKKWMPYNPPMHDPLLLDRWLPEIFLDKK